MSYEEEPSLLYILTLMPWVIVFSISRDCIYISPFNCCLISVILPTYFYTFDLFSFSNIFYNSDKGIILFCLLVSTIATNSSRIFFLSLGSLVRILSIISNKKFPNSSLCAAYLLYLYETITRISLKSHYWIRSDLLDLVSYCFNICMAGMNNFSLRILLFLGSVPIILSILSALSNYL